MSALSSWRRVVPVEQYNDSPLATYSRTLDQRNPYTRSSVTRVHPMHEAAKPLALHQWALLATYVIGAIAIAVVIYVEWHP